MSKEKPNFPLMSTKEPLAQVFQKSVSPYSKALAVHPHLYGGELYNRASELKALDRLIIQLQLLEPEIKKKNYSLLPPILEAIKDALNGNPKLSWWNLVTVSIGQAFYQEDDEEDKNSQEILCLSEISKILTEIIRTYHSSNTKLLLEIRLTTLEIDSRLIELEKIPGSTKESNETLEYLSSEFHLLTRELDAFIKSAEDSLQDNFSNLQVIVKKIVQLLGIVSHLAETHPEIVRQFNKKEQLQNFIDKVCILIKKTSFFFDPAKMSLWASDDLLSFLNLFIQIPKLVEFISIIDLSTLLIHLEQLFVNDKNLDKTRPSIFASPFLVNFVSKKSLESSTTVDVIRLAARGKKDPSIADPLKFLKNALMEENDLHNICTMIRFKSEDLNSGMKNPSAIQNSCLNNLKTMAHNSQPKDLDHILKSFTTDAMATRYFLLQEVILEQFIYWRKHGIF